LKLQVAPPGIPEQLKLIGRLNPFIGTNVTVRLDDVPGIRLMLELLTVIAYAGVAAAATLTAIAAEVEGESLLSPA
jgi:hypothetical protein